jgi:hypothetical protein
MRNQYKILAEQYNQVQDETTRKNLAGMQSFAKSQAVVAEYNQRSQEFGKQLQSLIRFCNDEKNSKILKQAFVEATRIMGPDSSLGNLSDMESRVFVNQCWVRTQEHIVGALTVSPISPADMR